MRKFFSYPLQVFLQSSINIFKLRGNKFLRVMMMYQTQKLNMSDLLCPSLHSTQNGKPFRFLSTVVYGILFNQLFNRRFALNARPITHFLARC